MNYKKLLFKPGQAGFVWGAALLLTLTGCVGYVEGPAAGVYVEPPAATVVVQDNYVYYPTYGIYFNSYRNEYAFMDGGVWVSRPQPIGVSVNVLLASPFVRMDFHDSPANHNAAVVQQYPRNWSPPPGAAQARKAQAQKVQTQKAQARKAPAPKATRKPEKHDEHQEK
jgi:hypothetical protein